MFQMAHHFFLLHCIAVLIGSSMRKVSVAGNLLIERIIIFTDFHERTCLHYFKYFIYTCLHTFIHTYRGLYTQMLTYTDLPMNQLPKGFTLLSH